MQRVCNFGSVLQAYSLKSILAEMGHDIEFIDIEEYSDDVVMLAEYTPNHNSEFDGYSSNKIVRMLNKIDRYSFYRLINRYKQVLQERNIRKFQDEVLGLNKNIYSEYDVCVIGSDEVFNCLQGKYKHLTTQLFGNVRQAKKVITYAASCGFTSKELLPDILTSPIQNALRNLSAISVRDRNTKKFVESLLPGKEVFQHLDPVLIGEFDKEITRTSNTVKIHEKYCLIYSYANRIHEDEEINAIKAFCKRNKMRIIAVGFQQRWIPDFVVASPFEALYLFKHAEFVITDTFHGTIFSSKYSKRFAVILRDSNNNKLSDLVHKLSIEKHVAQNIDDLSYAYAIENDTFRIKEICKKARQESIQYLSNNI